MKSSHIKISIAASLFVSIAFGVDSVSLNAIDVTSTGAGYDGVDEAKVSTRNANLLKDVFRDIPGVYVGGTNGMNQKIYMRGVSDRGLNITIDGAKQNGNTFHHNADLLIDPDLIKAVDVQTGAHSVVNGSGALGGSVAFKTVDAGDLLEDGQDIGAKIKAGYTSNNNGYSQSIMLYGRAFDGLELLGAFKHYGYGFSKSGNSQKIGGDGNDINYLFKIGYSFLDFHKLILSKEHMQYKGKYPLRAEFGSWLDGQLDNRKYERDTNTIKYTFNPSDLLELDITGYNTKHQRIGSTYANIKWGVETNGAKIGSKTKLEIGNFTHILRYGFDYYQSKNYVKPQNITPEQANNYSIYFEDSIKHGSLTLTPGIRYEIHELKTYTGRAGNLSSYKYKFNEVSPALAVDYDVGYGASIFASYAKVFRGPDVMESMLAAGESRGRAYNWQVNTELKATTGNSYEIGGRYRIDIDERSFFSFLAKYYKTEYKNLISDNNAANGTINNVLRRINIGGADIDGVELWAKLNLDTLSLAASYTHQNVKYKNRFHELRSGRGGALVDTYPSSNLLGYRDQGDKYTLNAEYAISSADLLLGYNLLFFKSRNTKSASGTAQSINQSVKMPSYAVSDIYVTYAPSHGRFKGVEINAGLYNMFNKAYASHSQRTAEYTGDSNTIDWEQGRNFKVNVSYKF